LNKTKKSSCLAEDSQDDASEVTPDDEVDDVLLVFNIDSWSKDMMGFPLG